MGLVLRRATNQPYPDMPSTGHCNSAYADVRIPPQHVLRPSRIAARVGDDLVYIVPGVPIGEMCGGRKRVEDEGGDEIHGSQ